MAYQYFSDPMLEMYIFETSQLIEQLEGNILSSEKSSCYSQDTINEIFRIMHTIKGSSAMMLFNNISALAHSIEDLFYYLREQKPQNVDCSTLSDMVLEGVDFIKVELQKIKSGDKSDGDSNSIIGSIKEFLSLLIQKNPSRAEIKKPISNRKQNYYIAPGKKSNVSGGNAYRATIFYQDGCEMENIRAYTVIHNLKEITEDINFFPEDIVENDDSVQVIRDKGFTIYIRTDKSYEEMHKFFTQVVFLRELELIQLRDDEEIKEFIKNKNATTEENIIKVPLIKDNEDKEPREKEVQSLTTQSIISVNVDKLDKLMDLVGEMVIAEAMVTQNPDLKKMELDNFHKAARQLHKITNEIQDTVMSIRMVPLSTTFHKMHRVVRDMSKKLFKEVKLEIIGEETEVDKNIIEHISDPLMHLVRNSIDHGIESIEERLSAGKAEFGTVTIEARNAGSDVIVTVKDDGKGLNKEKILKKAMESGLLIKPGTEMNDKEIYNLVLLPGFSTKDAVSEFSGRGVGMDVVTKNIEAMGGSVSADSIEGSGSTITLKIPLTLAIIDGMNVKVGNSRYTIPIIAIKESFRPNEGDIIRDPDGNEMLMVRGQCYSILRLHELYGVKTKITDFTKGVLIMVEQDDKTMCIFVDELLGQQQVVVKALPNYIKNTKRIEGLAGCTLLGDGSISLIFDVAGLINANSLT